MIKTIKFILAFYVLIISSAKSYAQQGVSASGNDGYGGGASINYTIGQIDYLNASSSGGSLNQGVQHPYIKIIADTVGDINVTLSPNPSSNLLILSIGNLDVNNISYRIYDVRGRLIANQNITSNQTSISLFSFTDASYYIEVFNNDSNLKTFKVIKN